MIKKLRNSISLLLVVALLLPSVLKLGHHHQHLICNAQHEKHLHQAQEECAVCNFTTAFFLSQKINYCKKRVDIIDGYLNLFTSFSLTSCRHYSFLLRGPPTYTFAF